MRHHARVNNDDEARDSGAAPAPAPAPTDDVVEDDDDFEDDDFEDDDRDRARASVARQNRVAAAAAIVMALVLAFGSGIVVGRATVSGSGSAGNAASPAATSPVGAALPGASPDASSGAPSDAPLAVAPAPSSALDGLPADGALLGSKSAKLTIVYWADYQCPFCSKFVRDTLPLLASRITDGTVAVLHRDYTFIGPESIDAAIAVRCAGEQGKYWPMHDAVYANQSGENQGTFSQAFLAAIAASIGLDATTFATCSASHDALVNVLADTGAAVRSGVVSTPSIDVGAQRFVGVSDPTAFLAAVDAAAAAGATPGPSPTVSPTGNPWNGTATDGRTAGPPSAPVTVQLWMDYGATASVDIAQTLEPALRTRIAAGKIRVELHDLVTLGAESVTAASAVRCVADQHGQAFLVSDVLAVNTQGPGAGLFVSRNLLALGARMGMDVLAMDACMTAPATASAVTAETAQGTKAGLTAAPAVIVKVGDREVARFTGTLDMTKVLAAIDAAK
jgi:protein-disulfide isomerase